MLRLLKILLTLLGAVVVSVVAYKAITYKLDQLKAADAAQSSPVTAEVRNKQLDCLTKNIYYEAGSEPFEGKVAVAQVTINRVESGKFPDDICKVVYQKDNAIGLCQFSWFCNGDVRKPKHPATYEESHKVAKMVLLEGFRLPSVEEALYFHGDYINPGWKKEKVAKIGRHIFYK